MVERVPRGSRKGGQFSKNTAGKAEKVPKGPINKSHEKLAMPNLLPSPEKYKLGYPIETLSYIPIPVFGSQKILGFIPKKHNLPVGFKYSLESDEVISLKEGRNRGATWQCKCGRAHLYVGSDFGFSDATTRTGWITNRRGIDYKYRLSHEEKVLVNKLYKKNNENKNIESSKWLYFEDKHNCQNILSRVFKPAGKSNSPEHFNCICGKEYVYVASYVSTNFLSIEEYQERQRKAIELAQAEKAAKEARKTERLEKYKKSNGGSAEGFEEAEEERRRRKAREREEDDWGSNGHGSSSQTGQGSSSAGLGF